LRKSTVLELPIRNGGEAVSCGAPNADYILVGQSVDPFSHQEPITEQFVLLCQELPHALIGIARPPGLRACRTGIEDRQSAPADPGGSSQRETDMSSGLNLVKGVPVAIQSFFENRGLLAATAIACNSSTALTSHDRVEEG
jgi:hypothetical protein